MCARRARPMCAQARVPCTHPRHAARGTPRSHPAPPFCACCVRAVHALCACGTCGARARCTHGTRTDRACARLPWTLVLHIGCTPALHGAHHRSPFPPRAHTHTPPRFMSCFALPRASYCVYTTHMRQAMRVRVCTRTVRTVHTMHTVHTVHTVHTMLPRAVPMGTLVLYIGCTPAPRTARRRSPFPPPPPLSLHPPHTPSAPPAPVIPARPTPAPHAPPSPHPAHSTRGARRSNSHDTTTHAASKVCSCAGTHACRECARARAQPRRLCVLPPPATQHILPWGKLAHRVWCAQRVRLRSCNTLHLCMHVGRAACLLPPSRPTHPQRGHVSDLLPRTRPACRPHPRAHTLATRMHAVGWAKCGGVCCSTHSQLAVHAAARRHSVK
jgi:hypothetical protein